MSRRVFFPGFWLLAILGTLTILGTLAIVGQL